MEDETFLFIKFFETKNPVLKLNKANPVIKKFMELDDAISDYYAPLIEKEMLVKA